jgi:hypothetical protein
MSCRLVFSTASRSTQHNEGRALHSSLVSNGIQVFECENPSLDRSDEHKLRQSNAVFWIVTSSSFVDMYQTYGVK